MIASQAMITGAFSITRQAIQLGYAPRMNVMHTSEREIGQIYVPFINWTLLVGVVALVLGFQTSSNLAAAYGIAVTATMAIDSVLVFFIARGLWGWRWPVAFAVSGGFFLVDMALFSANLAEDTSRRLVPDCDGGVYFYSAFDVEARTGIVGRSAYGAGHRRRTVSR